MEIDLPSNPSVKSFLIQGTMYQQITHNFTLLINLQDFCLSQVHNFLWVKPLVLGVTPSKLANL